VRCHNTLRKATKERGTALFVLGIDTATPVTSVAVGTGPGLFTGRRVGVSPVCMSRPDVDPGTGRRLADERVAAGGGAGRNGAMVGA